MPPQLADILFAGSAAAVLILSLTVVLARNPVRAVLLLILSFLPTALLYILLRAPFVGILQVLVYGGAIMMLFTFVIMMINPAPHGGEVPGEPARRVQLKELVFWLALPVAAGIVLIPPVYRAAQALAPVAVEKPGFGGPASLGAYMFRDPLNNPLTVSFELISFLILVGIIAALNFSRRRGAVRPPENP